MTKTKRRAQLLKLLLRDANSAVKELRVLVINLFELISIIYLLSRIVLHH